MVPIPAHFGPLTQSWRQRAEMGVGGSTLLSPSLPCRSSASRCYLREWCPGMWNPQWKWCKKVADLTKFLGNNNKMHQSRNSWVLQTQMRGEIHVLHRKSSIKGRKLTWSSRMSTVEECFQPWRAQAEPMAPCTQTCGCWRMSEGIPLLAERSCCGDSTGRSAWEFCTGR